MTKFFYLHLSAPNQCSYLESKRSSSQVVVPPEDITAVDYADMLRQGFRRSGIFVYRPHCQHCQACMSLRVDVAKFVPPKRFRRILNKNKNLTCRELPLGWEEEHFQLYMRYQAQRHKEKQDEDHTRADYKEFVLNSNVNSRLLEYRDSNNLVVMVSLIDISDDGISAVYTFYDTDNKNSLGHYGILCQIKLCHALSKPWLYLGYWVEGCHKLNYKMDYQPAEVFHRDQWIPCHQD